MTFAPEPGTVTWRDRWNLDEVAARTDEEYYRILLEAAARVRATAQGILAVLAAPASSTAPDPLPTDPPTTTGTIASAHMVRAARYYLRAAPLSRASYFKLNAADSALYAQIAHDPDFLAFAPSPTVFSQSLRVNVRRIFELAKEERFQDGMQTEFSKSLLACIREYGTSAVRAIGEMIEDNNTSRESAAEALRWLGMLTDARTRSTARQLVERSLNSPSPLIRDAAGLALAFMDDPTAILPLRRAAEREPIQALRQDLLQVITQLEETAHAAGAKSG